MSEKEKLVLIVGSRIKEYVKSKSPDMRVSGDFADGLDEEVKCLIDDAIDRALNNDRKTVRPEDL